MYNNLLDSLAKEEKVMSLFVFFFFFWFFAFLLLRKDVSLDHCSEIYVLLMDAGGGGDRLSKLTRFCKR